MSQEIEDAIESVETSSVPILDLCRLAFEVHKAKQDTPGKDLGHLETRSVTGNFKLQILGGAVLNEAQFRTLLREVETLCSAKEFTWAATAVWVLMESERMKAQW